MQRYQQVAEDIRHAFAGAGIAVTQLNSSHSLNSAALELTALLTPKEQ
jgi:hypothetical protein